MTSPELEALVGIGQLKRETPSADELGNLRRSGAARLTDAANVSLALESRFDLVYNAAHSLALAGLRRLGYRPANRYLVFQTLPHTLGLTLSASRILSKGHQVRNAAEYEGAIELDERLVTDMIAATRLVLKALDNSMSEQS